MNNEKTKPIRFKTIQKNKKLGDFSSDEDKEEKAN